MTDKGIGFASIVDKVVSHGQGLGVFDSDNGNEILNPPGLGVHGEVWVATIDPVQASGLDSTSIRLGLNFRVRTDMRGDPKDGIDPRIVGAVDVLFGSLHNDFTLDGDARYIDLLGARGVPLSARGGYLDHGGVQWRVLDVIVPIIIDDCWSQIP